MPHQDLQKHRFRQWEEEKVLEKQCLSLEVAKVGRVLVTEF